MVAGRCFRHLFAGVFFAAGWVGPAAALDVATIIERVQLDNAWVAPNGTQVLYRTKQASLATNRYTRNLWLYDIASGLTTALKEANRGVAGWRPDSKALAFIDGHNDVQLFEVGSAAGRLIVPGALIAQAVPPGDSVQVLRALWSPTAARLALILEVAGRTAEGSLTGVEVGPGWPGPSAAGLVTAPKNRLTLAVINVGAGRVEYVLPSRFHLFASDLECIDWSPDGSKIVFSASLEASGASLTSRDDVMEADLYIVDLSDEAVRPLVTQRGIERSPHWSPDGRTIAFATQRGTADWTYETTLGLVSTSYGAKPSYPLAGRSEDPSTLNLNILGWSTTGEELFYTADVRGVKAVFAVGALDGTIETVAMAAGRNYEGLSKAAFADVIAMVVQDFNTPPDLVVWSRERSQPRRVTDLNPGFRRAPLGNAEQIQWKSADGRWDLSGYLLRPIGKHKSAPFPLIAYAYGGPSMVSASFDYVTSYQYPWPLFLQSGYAVFIPNTRGRPGFGHAFQHAMRDEGSMHRIPATDLISGVDTLVRRGRVDGRQMGIVGFSYGGALAAYSLIGTQRFKAASIGESIATFLTTNLHGEPWVRDLYADMYGMPSALERGNVSTLIQESPGYWTERIKTPCLLEYGLLSEAFEEGDAFYTALSRRGIAQFIVYPRSGHVLVEPKLLADSYRRNLEWFEYWVRGVATPNMRQRYGRHGVSGEGGAR